MCRPENKCLTPVNGYATVYNMPNEQQIRRFLQAIVRDANDALAALADGDYALAATEVECLAVDAANVVEGLRELADAPKGDQCECATGVCSDCVGRNAMGWL